MLKDVYQTLNDCKRSLTLLESVSDDVQLFRIYWISCVVLLHNVNDLFLKIARSNCRVKGYLSARLKDIGESQEGKGKDRPLFVECSHDYLIYHRFIMQIRNDIAHGNVADFLKDNFYAPIFVEANGVIDGDSLFSDLSVYHPMGDFDYWGDWDRRDWINKSIEWWETEVAAIEKCLTDEKRD